MKRSGAALIALTVMLAACSADNAKKRYILAEKLWGKGDYAGAVAEFDRVSRKDPKGHLGLQALYRAAMTQTLFLAQHAEAIRKFKSYIEAAGDSQESWSAQLQVGDILFSKLNSYDEAILQYRDLLRKRPTSPEVPEFLYRIARSHFFLWEFGEAIARYQEIIDKYPNTSWAEKAMFEIGVSYFTSGEQRPEGEGPGTEAYKKAEKAYEAFIQKYPSSPLASEAQFGIASCLEEQDQLEAAYEKYKELVGHYPSPKIIQIKLARIRERQSQRRR